MQVGIICVWFDLFLSRLICFLVDRFIFAQFDLYLCKLDLFARVSIYLGAVRLTFCGFDFIVDDFRFIFDRLIMFVRVSFCLFCDLKILAVTERHRFLWSCKLRLN